MSHACSYQEMIPPQVPLPLRVGVGLLARCGTALPPPPPPPPRGLCGRCGLSGASPTLSRLFDWNHPTFWFAPLAGSASRGPEPDRTMDAGGCTLAPSQ
jgi:hypothetical protein